jgi:hypothetical protein
MPEIDRRIPKLFPLAMAVLAFTAGPCDDTSGDCAAESLPQLIAFREGSPATADFTGVLISISDAGEDFSRLIFRGASDQLDSLRVSVPGGLMSLDIDRSYNVRVEHVGGMPAASSLVISDSNGLVLAGATDGSVGGHVLKDGLPGFDFQLADGGCESRDQNNCHEAIINRRLDVHGTGSDSVSLFNGGTGRLGQFEVVCLVAQHVDYSKECADAGVPAVSWIVARVDSASVYN